MKRLRRWWCNRQHDKGWRLHGWVAVDDIGTIECCRCGERRDPPLFAGRSYGTTISGLLVEYRRDGRL